MCPNPPSPTTATRSPFWTPKWRSGDQVVIPAQSSGAAPLCRRPFGMRTT